QQTRFGNDKLDTLPEYCRKCEVRFACNGECPKHRYMKTPDGEEGLNYLCHAHKRSLNHSDPYMKIMTDLLRRRQAPAQIMQILAQQEAAARRPAMAGATAARSAAAPGRNDPCPCGSGRKFKKCCGA